MRDQKKSTVALLTLLLSLGACQAPIDEITFSQVVVEAQSYSSGRHSDWQDYDTRIIDPSSKINPVKLTTYGSLADSQFEATGFFRTQKIDGRWWVIDPNGHQHYQRGITSVRPGSSENSQKALVDNFGDGAGWIASTIDKFRDISVYTTGAWSEDDLVDDYNATAEEPFAHTRLYNFMSSYGKKRGGTYQRAGNIGYPNQTIFVFDPEFEEFCDEYASKVIAPHKDDTSLLGYFSDNEMPLGRNNLEGYLTLEDPEDHGRKAAEAFLSEKGVDASQITDELREEFAGIVADRYYSIVSAAIRKYDPNHMYVGSRLHGGAKFVRQVVEAAAKHCDIVSINFYGVWAPSERHIENWSNWGDAPLMITEFYTKSMDSGLGNSTGAGFRVKTQQDRGYFYQNFCLNLLEAKNFVGWHYFRYQDNDPTEKGADPSNIDSNKGIVTNKYEYYDDFMVHMAKLNESVYSLINHFDKQ